MPKRIQRKRTKNWRMPDKSQAVYVGRPTCYGNPFKSGDRAADVAAYRRAWSEALQSARTHPCHPPMPFGKPVYLGPLRGKDLVCWCPIDQPCHADVLLEIANS